MLVNFCNNFYKNKNALIEKTKELCEYYAKNRNEYKEDYKNRDDNDLIKYFLFNTYYCIRRGLQPNNGRVPKYIGFDAMTRDFDLFFMKNEYKNMNYKEAIDQFLYDSKCLVILDPPYLNTNNGYSDNKNASQQNKEHEIMWEYIYNLFINESHKCRAILIVNDIFYMRILFNKFIVSSHNINYMSHEIYKTRHIVCVK